MNKYAHYDNMEYWFDDAWKGKNPVIDELTQWIGLNDQLEESGFQAPEGDPKKMEDYHSKTNSVDLPEVVSYWKSRGMRFHSFEMGCKHWVALVPEEAFTDSAKVYKVLVILEQQDPDDPWWAMKTMSHHKDLNEMIAARGDTMLVYMCCLRNDHDRQLSNILQEATVLFPADLDNMYLDVSLPLKKGQKMAGIPGFKYLLPDGTPADPDECVEYWDKFPVLNISNNWGNLDSLTRGLIMYHKMNDGMFDRERFVYGLSGKSLAEALRLEHDFTHVDDPAYIEYWDQQGIVYDIQKTKNRRWIMMAPKQAVENKEKLPLVVGLQEVYRGNEHLAVTAASYFYHFTELVMQGDCMLLFFVLEDPDSNDLLADILHEAFEKYPVDRTRVYTVGHSHDGWWSRIFGYRHPDLIAAVATLGNFYGLVRPEDIGNPYMSASDENIAMMKKVEMPIINVTGRCENAGKLPVTDEEKEKYVIWWQRRLDACNYPQKSAEEILASLNSPNKAIRELGLPADHAYSFYSYGIENYVGEFKDAEGRYRLSVASSENMPHLITSPMVDIAWNFLRRFARDPETGKTIDLE